MSGSFRAGRRWLLALGALAAAGLLAAAVGARLDQVLRAGESVTWGWVAGALAVALASHACVGLALAETLAALGHDLGGAPVLGIALVSTTANYFLSAGGVTGFALKAHLLHKRRVPIGTTVTASAVTSAVMYAVLALILAQGFVALLFSEGVRRAALLESALGLLALLATAAAVAYAFVDQRLRGGVVRRLFHWTSRAAYSLSRTEIPPEDFAAFEEQLAGGLARVRARHGHLTMTVLYTCLDWGLAMAALWFCFRAVGTTLPIGHLSAAFTAGQAATLIPLLPAGLGAAEGGVAALMSGFGVEAGSALVAAMLFRLVYHVVPSLLSVLVFWGLKVSEPKVLEEAAGVHFP